ncbi:hypothetical protein F4776DRAFT_644424 [Hypoxylon sp. NC0597]|nr:hypothetical protein F4776DRAFT_644424 [Hypoxylon sp. NC0597]
MQQPKFPRFSTTPGQRPPNSPSDFSDLYRPQLNGYSRHLQSLPAAHEYLPQQISPQEHHRLVSDSPHAIPLRIQLATMNKTETRPMPIPSLQLSTDRPYSVPTYLNYRAKSDNGASFAQPPRPASSSEVDGISRLVPSRPVLFPQHRTTQKVETDSLTSHRISSVDGGRPMKIPTIPRAVAKRGPKTLSNNSSKEGGRAGFSLALFPPEQNLSEAAGGQKRATELTAMKYFPSKRININVTLTQSQTTVTPEAHSPMYPYIRDSHIKKNNFAEDNAIEKETSKALEEADDTSTQVSDSESEVTEALLTSRRLGQDRPASAAKSDQHGNISSINIGPIEGLQETRDSVKKAVGVLTPKISNVANAIPTSPNALSETLDGKDQTRSRARTQCDADLDVVLSATQQQREGEVFEDRHRSTLGVSGISNARDLMERKVNDETLVSRLSRVEEVINVQKTKGMDGFIRARLGSEDPNLLETLTNEILLGLVARDEKLLEQVVGIM